MENVITPTQASAFQLYQQTISLVKEQRKLFLDLGFTLAEIKRKKLYRYMGDGGFETWKSFLGNPEINIKEITAETYIKVFEFYIEKLQLPREQVLDIPLVRLNMMKAKMETATEEERGELIEKAKVLSYKDFQAEIYDGEKRKQKIKITKCKGCKKLKIEYDQDEICMCLGTANIVTHPVSS